MMDDDLTKKEKINEVLFFEFILVHLIFRKSEQKKVRQKIVTNPTQKVSDK